MYISDYYIHYINSPYGVTCTLPLPGTVMYISDAKIKSLKNARIPLLVLYLVPLHLEPKMPKYNT